MYGSMHINDNREYSQICGIINLLLLNFYKYKMQIENLPVTNILRKKKKKIKEGTNNFFFFSQGTFGSILYSSQVSQLTDSQETLIVNTTVLITFLLLGVFSVCIGIWIHFSLSECSQGLNVTFILGGLRRPDTFKHEVCFFKQI